MSAAAPKDPGASAHHQNAILGVLADGACRHRGVIASALAARGLEVTERMVTRAASMLVVRGLAERTDAGCYRITADGSAMLAEGRVVASGPRHQYHGPRVRRRPDSLRVRLWRAIRIRAANGAVTATDLVRLAVRDHEDPAKAVATARFYLSALVRTGILYKLPKRAKREDGRPGEHRYRLARDPGPQAPQVTDGGHVLRDPNSGQDIPIPRLWERGTRGRSRRPAASDAGAPS